ncbi:glycoside hydrolase family 125 protein [Marinifilum caeruleilacunae]|uniref:Glycoside hydrolase family 125 protein n=1 Tax=Marinifilum caeruleilacunae TaxID=2499076 RepID=A0ABX1WXH6_9BACT|nr:glycoside hydrolase family 125 protein [Marinifilum caeruleilacunae]NOU60787.1 glycoside hydrolase family 125 protein [Marinifilum caeruleilacunae]
MKRRTFLRNSLLFTGGLSLIGTKGFAISKDLKYISNRPEANQRNFVSKAVDRKIKEVKKAIANEELAWMFENCFPNTLDTTVSYSEENGKPDSFVITGDIHAMWLRDSTAQVWPYLPLVNDDEQLQKLFRGLINRQSKCINIDPYANAFNKGAEGSHWESDLTDMKPELHERKWEIDSLCYAIRLAYHYWKKTGDTSCFDSDWRNAMNLVVRTFKEQQRKEDQGPYRFARNTSKPTDTLPGNGYGNPIKPVGLIVSSFRPSDDATILPFLIPSNFFAVVSLQQLNEILNHLNIEKGLANSAMEMAKEVEAALVKYASSNHLNQGETLAFEVDGFGNQMYMDDANIPSLLSLPYLGALDAKSSLYQNTRKFILSENNPWYFKGEYAEGIGGPHVGVNMIWPMSIIMQAMTSDQDKEIENCLETLIRTHAGTGFMHETFHKDDPKNFTRSWFAWANTLFGELILKIYKERPHLLKQV